MDVVICLKSIRLLSLVNASLNFLRLKEKRRGLIYLTEQKVSDISNNNVLTASFLSRPVKTKTDPRGRFFVLETSTVDYASN